MRRWAPSLLGRRATLLLYPCICRIWDRRAFSFPPGQEERDVRGLTNSSREGMAVGDGSRSTVRLVYDDTVSQTVTVGRLVRRLDASCTPNQDVGDNSCRVVYQNNTKILTSISRNCNTKYLLIIRDVGLTERSNLSAVSQVLLHSSSSRFIILNASGELNCHLHFNLWVYFYPTAPSLDTPASRKLSV